MSAHVELHKWVKPAPGWITVLAVLFFFIANSPLQGASVVGTRHDLSTGTTTRVCVFCHTPHMANPDVNGPLWNRAGTPLTFTPYTSPTMESVPGQPSPVSALCLGCHDGVISQVTVYGLVFDNKHHLLQLDGFPDTTSYPNCERCHSDFYSGKPRTLILGTDLSDDHPISMDYPASAKFNVPPDVQNGWGNGNVRLVGGMVECVSCHNVHDNSYPPFMIKSNAGSAVCMTCHNK